MQLSPEERRKIYEEEKARIEAERKEQATAGGSTTGLEPSTAGLLCYLGGWISGIIFLVIEQENRFVRFHALQSIVTFGALTVAGAVLGWIPYVGSIFATIIGIMALVLWILLMVKAHKGQLYKVPLAGQVAEAMLPVAWRTGAPEAGEAPGPAEPAAAEGAKEPAGTGETPPPPASEKSAQVGEQREDYFAGTRATRIAGYSIVIALNVALLVFLCFFHRYIAWYSTGPGGAATRSPILTDDYFRWLPVLVVALAISIGAHIALIIHDRYWLREAVQIVLAAIGVGVVANLLAIFPFDFTVIPDANLADIMPAMVNIGLVVVAFVLGISALVRFIKVLVGVPK
ncbi:MAG: DUF4870 domain-containing protein [Dehalococcoidia bacterium]